MPSKVNINSQWKRKMISGLIFVLTVGLAVILPGHVKAAVITLENETFTNNSTVPSEWISGGTNYHACLTAGDNTTPSTSIPACPDIHDTNGNGALRLTNASMSMAGYVILNKDINLDRGLDITFEQYQYNGIELLGRTGDGIGFFLIDGSYSPTLPGGWGAALGYARNCPIQSRGLIGGWAGIGLDSFGNFPTTNAGGAWGVPATSNCNTSDYSYPAPGYTANSVSIRGAGAPDGMSGYQLANPPVVAPKSLSVAGVANRDPAKRTVHVTINPQKFMEVEIDFHDGNGFVKLQSVDLTTLNTGAMPSRFKIGFSAGTGNATNIQEISGLVVTQLAPSLHINKTVVNPPTIVHLGDTLTYNLAISNDKAAAVTDGDVTVVDTLPQGLTLAPGSLPSECTVADRTITCIIRQNGTTPALVAGQTVNFNFQVTVDRAGEMINTASVYGGGDPNCLAVNDCRASDTITVAPDLSIKKTIVNPPVKIHLGEELTYNLAISNHPQAAPTNSNVTVVDTLPSGLNFVANSWPGTCTVSGQTITCLISSANGTDPALAAGQTTNIQYKVTLSEAGNKTNTASVYGGGDTVCTEAGKCASSNVVAATPDISISKTAVGPLPQPITVGDRLTYNLTVTNNQNAAPTNGTITISDTLPSNLAIVSAELPSNCSESGSTITCTLTDSILPGQSVNSQLVVDVTGTGNIVNTASVYGGGDPVCIAVGNCNSTFATEARPNLAIRKFIVNPPAAIKVGDTLTYTLEVSNSEDAAANTSANVMVSDPLPAGLSFVANSWPSNCTVTDNTLNCTIEGNPALAIGATAVIEFQVTVTSAAEIINTASVYGGGDPSCSEPGRCTGVSVIQATPSLTLVKSLDNPPTQIQIGDALTFNLAISNGASGAPTNGDVTVVDTLPDGLNFVTNSWPSNCAVSGRTITCTISPPSSSVPALTAGQTVNVQFQATIDRVGSTINTASVYGGGDPACIEVGNCTGSNTVTVTPDLTLHKTVVNSPTPIRVGDTITYNLAVNNDPSAAATMGNIIVSDLLPAGLQLSNGSWPSYCEVLGRTLTCTITDSLAPGQTVNIRFQAVTTATGNIVNAASVYGGGDPICVEAGRCTETVTITVEPRTPPKKENPPVVQKNNPPTSSNTPPSAPQCTAQKPNAPAPYIHKATSDNNKSITLHFNTGGEPFTKYLVQYGYLGSGFTFGATIDNPKSGSFTINDLTPGKSYQFQLIPMNDCAGGPSSNIFPVKLGGTLPKVPGVPSTGKGPVKARQNVL